ncbi:MAG: hypothetical protein ABSH48_26920 [Verrucomicrobiota bacterium]|jgi:hypothetical protein
MTDPIPVLQKQQTKEPTSMRFERVQEILENDLLIKTKLSPRVTPIDTRFGQTMMFSKEVLDVTRMIHAEGRDAHKLPKNEIVRIALRALQLMPAGNDVVPNPVAPESAVKPEAIPPTEEKPKETKAVIPKKPTPAVVTKPAPQKAEVKTAIKTKGRRATDPEAVDEDDLPESELPPERQPLHLPVNFDPRKYPHYDVQKAIYSMLLSGLNLSEHFEKFPGFEERQRDMELIIKKYVDTCDGLKNGLKNAE